MFLNALPDGKLNLRAILSLLSAPRRDVVLTGVDWAKRTGTTITTREALDEELAQIAARGWGVDDGEFEDFTNCIAAPVSNATGTIVGAISITSIRVVNDLEALQVHTQDLVETARRVSTQLS